MKSPVRFGSKTARSSMEPVQDVPVDRSVLGRIPDEQGSASPSSASDEGSFVKPLHDHPIGGPSRSGPEIPPSATPANSSDPSLPHVEPERDSPALSFPAYSYQSLVRLLPANTDEDTYDTLRSQIASDHRLEEPECRVLLQALYEKETFGSRCEWCGRGNGGLACVSVNDGLILAVCGTCAPILREERRNEAVEKAFGDAKRRPI